MYLFAYVKAWKPISQRKVEDEKKNNLQIYTVSNARDARTCRYNMVEWNKHMNVSFESCLFSALNKKHHKYNHKRSLTNSLYISKGEIGHDLACALFYWTEIMVEKLPIETGASTMHVCLTLWLSLRTFLSEHQNCTVNRKSPERQLK